jgi:hypothetical protein
MSTSATIRTNKNLKVRRSQRVLLSMEVIVAGERTVGTRFAEKTTTVVVNAHGALVLLKEIVREEQLLRIRNEKTSEEQACKVVVLGESREGKMEVGIEFIEPAPRFWRIAFPPEDWNSSSPEAKRYEKLPKAEQKKVGPPQ